MRMPSMARARALMEKGDFIPVLILVVAIQGTVLISQSVAALFLNPVVIGQIRLFESVVSVAVLVAGFGAPALAIREMAAHAAPGARASVLRTLILLPFIGTGLLALASVGAMVAGVQSIVSVSHLLAAALLLLVAVNLVRLASAVSQGLLIVRQVYFWVLAGSLLSVIAQVTGGLFASLPSWIAGRLAGELVLLACIFFGMRSSIATFATPSAFSVQQLWQTMARAMAVNAGLLLRMIADALPILLLGAAVAAGNRSATAADVGHLGLATLFLTAAMLPPAVISQRTLPLITGEQDASRRTRLIKLFLKRMLLAGVAVASIGALAALALRLLDEGRLEAGLIASAAVMMAVPFKAMATAFGTLMLARGDFSSPFWITLIEAICVAVTANFAIAQSALAGTVLVIIAGAIISLAGLCMMYARRGNEATAV
jgi:O-antigen/teichoic acid export membrane protein